MEDGLFERWIRSAAAIVQAARRRWRSSRGRYRWRRSSPRSPAASASAEIMPVHAARRRAGDPHRRRARRGSRGGAVAQAAACRCMRRPATAFRPAPTPSTTARPRFSAIDGRRSRHCARAGECLHAFQATSPENPLLRRFSEPPAAEIDAFGGGDDPGHPPARHDHGRRRPVPAEPVARLDRRPDREGLRLPDAPAVAISINSPGGSPVQSRLIYKRIRDLAAEKNKTRAGLRRGRRGLRRLHDRGGRRRDHRRPLLDRRLDRRRLGLLRLPRTDEEDRRRAARPYGRPEQGGARPVPAGEEGGCRAAEGAAARGPRDLHRPGQGTARRQARRTIRTSSPACSGPARRAWSSAWSMRSATCARC